MSIETLGEAYRLSWRVRARCLRGTVETPTRLQRCDYQAELDMQTLVWAKGLRFPLGRAGEPPHVPTLRQHGCKRDLRAATDCGTCRGSLS
jgi:hypothetical protein